MTLNDFKSRQNPIAKYYKDFNVEGRILLTGHSHQAWPDVARQGFDDYWNDASMLVDDKWDLAFQKADRVRQGFSKIIGSDPKEFALASNTHDLLIKFLSALDLKNRPKIITSDAEFHTVRRQLDSLQNAGYIDLVRANAMPVDTLSERIASAIDDKTSLVIVSKVFYNNSLILEEIGKIQNTCQHHGAELLVDAYHAVNVAPFSIEEEELESSFVLGGGYKYCQLGEGNCFMRIPASSRLKPVFTGWYSEFMALADKKEAGQVPYGPDHWAFAGSTYEPISHYRAAKVFDFFANMELNPGLLRQISQFQIGLLAAEFDKFDFDPQVIRRNKEIDLSKTGGFLILESGDNPIITSKLKENNVIADYRGNKLRLGPAPYLNPEQLKNAIEILFRVCRDVRK
jgi:kynureninase